MKIKSSENISSDDKNNSSNAAATILWAIIRAANDIQNTATEYTALNELIITTLIPSYIHLCNITLIRSVNNLPAEQLITDLR